MGIYLMVCHVCAIILYCSDFIEFFKKSACSSYSVQIIVVISENSFNF